VQDDAQESPQPGEDETEIVSDGGKIDVSGVACATLEIAAYNPPQYPQRVQS